jgi:hypothetical protein
MLRMPFVKDDRNRPQGLADEESPVFYSYTTK